MKRSYAKIIVLIAIIIFISSIIIVYWISETKEKTNNQETQKTLIDDQISPLENQGLSVSIDRIRYRGLLEKLIKPGIHGDWKDKPKYYYIVKIDDLEYISKNVEALGAASEIYYEEWDTFGQENRVTYDTPEEQELSQVIIKIVEVLPLGIVGHRIREEVQETIILTYDYRTGRWSGDDSFSDSDGYGHYRGKTFEVWFGLHSNDCDLDGIPYWTEVNIIYTNPRVDDSKQDPDNDGIPTSWEWKWGYDPFFYDNHTILDPDIDGIQNSEEFFMEKYYANPFEQDIYVEVDGMEATGLFDPAHMLLEESKQGIIERFSQHDINMYIDDGWADTPPNGGGELLPHYETISQDSGMTYQFYASHFPDERKGIFHYLLVPHGGGFSIPQIYNNMDVSVVGFDKFIHLRSPLQFHTPWCILTPRNIRVHLGAMSMHELGHTLGITPWTFKGCDNYDSFYIPLTKEWREYRDTWGDYYSVMNYYWVCCNDFRKVLFDYSGGSNGSPYDQNDWEHLYLPTFETTGLFIEQANIEPDEYHEIDKIDDGVGAIGRLEAGISGWTFSENLTNLYLSTIFNEPLSSVNCDIRVYSMDNCIRIYAQPQVAPTYAEYCLVEECWIGSSGEIGHYSII